MPAVVVPPPPVDFFAVDRHHALTAIRQIADLAADTVRDLIAHLDAMAHTGPAHVHFAGGSARVTPFDFIRV